MLRIIMNGYNGKMGKVIIELVENSSDCEIVAGVDYIGGRSGLSFPTYSNIFECDMEADVIIDFSNANGISNLLEYCAKTSTPLVLCTTGLSNETLKLVNKSSEKVAILKSANMSLGINLIASLMNKIVETLADSNFDIEIIEKHHNQKIDAPSGTALLLADEINKSAGNKYDYVYDRSSTREKRTNHEIGFSAIRGGTIVGEHSVLFIGKDETIELTHIATSKEVFAVGALKAARFLAGKPAGLYDMSNVME